MIHSSTALITPCSALDAETSATVIGRSISLLNGRVHEVMGMAADMFVLAAAAHANAETIWIGLRRDVETLCPSGLQSYLNPESFLIIEGVSRGELLWAAEQSLRAEGGFTVVLEMPDSLSLYESRRLQLAAEEGGSLGLIILHGQPFASAAQTRWYCEPKNEEHPTWLWDCIKGKRERWVAGNHSG